MSQIIGIRHRRKKTAGGESRPTQLYNLGTNASVNLADEDAELEFIKKSLQPGDQIAMILGGSGDAFAYALARKALELGQGTGVYRIPPFVLKKKREEMGLADDKAEDAKLLALLLAKNPELFYPVKQYDMDLIYARELTIQLVETMKNRIACEMRIQQRVVGQRFIEEGLWPQGRINDAFKAAKSNDAVLQAILKQEGQIERRLGKALEKLPIYNQLFAPIVGVGVRIAARIISGIGDIRRFGTVDQFKAFCGVHCLSDGRFARQRKGRVANWDTSLRHAFVQLGVQFNRRPQSPWGERLLQNKRLIRERHPEEEKDEKTGKRRYTKGHTLKMAIWRTLTQFAVQLYREWRDLEEIGTKGRMSA